MVASNYMPDVLVEIAFNAGYTTPAASRVWTDVSAYVELDQRIDITRGRSDELSDIPPSELKLTLKNSDGRFTAGLASSPYHPDVKIGRPIRVTATPVGGTASVRFVGYVEEWPVAWEGHDREAHATITAYSRRARGGRGNERRSVIEETCLAIADPFIYWPLGDPAGSTQVTDISGNNRTGETTPYGNPITFGEAIGPGTDDLTAARFTTGCRRLRYEGSDVITTDQVTISYFFNTTSELTESWVALYESLPSPSAVGVGVSSGKSALITFGDDAFASVTVRNGSTTGTFGSLTGGPGLSDGLTHHMMVAIDLNGTSRLFVDGVQVDTAAYSLLSGWTLTNIAVGGKFDNDFPTYNGDGFTISHVCVWPTALTATEAQAIYQAGMAGFSGDRTDQRIARYAAWEGIPVAEQTLATGLETVGHIPSQGKNILELFDLVAATENSTLFDRRDGGLQFHNRQIRYNATAAFTLSMASQQVESDYAPRVDRSQLLNDVDVSLLDGSASARSIDSASRDEYGVGRTSVELAAQRQTAADELAGWLTTTYAVPAPRVPSVTVDLLPLAVAVQNQVMAADINSRFAITGAPSNAPAASPAYFIEGYSEEIGPESYVFTFNVSNASIWDVFELDDATFGVLDSDRLAL